MRVTVTVDVTRSARKGYWGNLGEATSQMLHAIIGGNANLTFSAQCGYWQEIGDPRGAFFAPIVNWLFRNPYHCKDAWRNRI
jgi:hypothetical protein